MRTIVMAVCSMVLVAGGCQAAGNAYRVSHVPDAAIRIDGELAEPVWRRAEALTAFRDPWRGGGLPTEFRACVDDQNLYFTFIVEDDSLRLEKGWQGEKTLDREDRVEIYFAVDARLEKYYCVEIDPEGRVHEFTGSFPRKWDNMWNLPGLKTAGRVSGKGYVVEGSVPLAALHALGLPPLTSRRRWRMGLFRADMGTTAADPVYWITWTDPRTPNPDFHVPAAFGAFQLGRRIPSE